MRRVYQACEAADVVQRPLDHLIALYHRPSGITHLVHEPVPQILSAMGECADWSDAATLYDHMAKSFDLGERSAALAVLEERLDELVEIGMINARDIADG